MSNALREGKCLYCKEPILVEAVDGAPVCGGCRKELWQKFQAQKNNPNAKRMFIPLRKRRYFAPKGRRVRVPATYKGD